jgi:hypothetical protein
VNAEQVAALRALLAPTGWLERAALFARALRRSSRTPGGLLVVGTPEQEPWQLAAHPDEESRLAGIPELAPTLVRWAPPVDAPAHLRIGLERIDTAGRGESLLVVSPQAAPDPLLERVQDARRGGTTILALGQGDRPLEEMADETLVVSPQDAPLSFEAAQHLVSAAAGERPGESKGFRARLARLLDTVSGPAPR